MIDGQDSRRPGAALMIGVEAPAFSTRTTMGPRCLSDYRGRWLVLFSHPADFTPVCTSEFVAFSKAHADFEALDCELLGLSIDSLHSHVAWVRAIARDLEVEIPFPIAEDPSMGIAAAYGMIPPGAGDSATVRATFLIDPLGVIRAILWYPMSTGRSVHEILRLVEALQVSDAHAVSTPEGWKRGDPVIDPPTLDLREGRDQQGHDPSWFFRTRKLEVAR